MFGQVAASQSESALVCLGGVLDPRMLEGLGGRQPLDCVRRQQLADQISRTAGHETQRSGSLKRLSNAVSALMNLLILGSAHGDFRLEL